MTTDTEGTRGHINDGEPPEPFAFLGADGWTWYGQDVDGDTIHACSDDHARAQGIDPTQAKDCPCYLGSANDGQPYNEETDQYEPDNVHCGACVEEAVAASRDHLAQARYLGADAALAAASWLVMSESDARSILDDVDPEVLDRYPEPDLSGAWADSWADALLYSVRFDMGCDVDDIPDNIADAWEEGRDTVWSDALQAHALRLLGDVIRALAVERVTESYVDMLRKAAGQ